MMLPSVVLYENRIRMHHTDPVENMIGLSRSVFFLFLVETLLRVSYYSSSDTLICIELKQEAMLQSSVQDMDSGSSGFS